MLTKEQIAAAADRPTETVPVPEWGGDVLVRTLSSSEKDAFETNSTTKAEDGKREVILDNLRARLVVLCLVDESGNRIFTDDDAAALGQKSGLVIGRIFEVCCRLNNMFQDKDKVKELEKN